MNAILQCTAVNATAHYYSNEREIMCNEHNIERTTQSSLVVQVYKCLNIYSF